GWSRFHPEKVAMAIVFLSAAWDLLVLSRLRRRGIGLRARGLCTTELTPGGVVARSAHVEARYDWVAGQAFREFSDDITLFLGRDHLLRIPRRAFPSPEAIASFLDAARSLHGEAMRAA